MAAVHDRADGNGSLVAAGAALDHPVRESIMLIATALRTLKAVRPPLLFQVIPALLFCGKSLLKLVQRQSLLPRHDSFPRFPVIMPSFYQLNCPIFRSWPWLTKRDNHLNKSCFYYNTPVLSSQVQKQVSGFFYQKFCTVSVQFRQTAGVAP